MEEQDDKQPETSILGDEPSQMQFRESFAPPVRAIMVCIVYMLVGPSLVIVNRNIMQGCKFRYPVTLCSIGFISSSIFARLLVWSKPGSVRPEALEAFSGRSWFRIALPIGICSALSLACGNAAYLYLGVGFIQMLKALNPAIVLVVMRLSGLVRQPSNVAVVCVLGIVAGTGMEIKGELHASGAGLILMLLSEVTEAIRLVMQQWLLQERHLTVTECMHSLAPPAAMCLSAAAILLEGPVLWARGDLRLVKDCALLFLLTSVLSVAVNFVGVMVVQETSALTCKVLNSVRNVGLVIVGAVFYREQSTLEQIVGYAIALACFAGYNYAQTYLDGGDVRFSKLSKVIQEETKDEDCAAEEDCANPQTPPDALAVEPLPKTLGAVIVDLE